MGDEAIELAARAGLDLLDWQKDDLRDLMALDEEGRWAHFEFGLNVARQNGKGSILEVRELALLAGITDETFGVHSAHEFKTSQEHFIRLQALLENAGLRIKTIRQASGQEGVWMMDGRRLRFVTRTKSGLRGFAGVDFLSLDEAMIINAASHSAMMPTLRASSAPRGPQLSYSGSAVDQEIHEHGIVFARLRERGLKGDDESLGYIEHSVAADHPDDVSDEMALDRELWRKANPSLGVLISEEHMAREQRSMDRRAFAVELLGVGDWPATDGSDDVLIDAEAWAAAEDPESVLVDPICLSFDVSPDRRAAIVACGANEHGKLHVEVVAARAGTGWLAEMMEALYRKHEVADVVCDGYGPAAAIARKVSEAGITVRTLNASEYGEACGQFVDQVHEGDVRHIGQDELTNAIRASRARPLVDRWAWSRTKSSGDITTLVGASIAHWSAVDKDVANTEMVIY